jgi:hypothetical protein
VYGVQRTGGQSLRRRTLRQKKSARALPHCPRRVPHRGHPRASGPGRGPTRGRERVVPSPGRTSRACLKSEDTSGAAST